MKFSIVVRFIKHVRAILICMFTSFFMVQNIFSQPLSYTINTYSKAPKGYFFLNTYKIDNNSGSYRYQMILDGTGHTIYYKNVGETYDFRIQRNGLISYYELGKFYLLDKKFNVVDSVACKNGLNPDFHEFQVFLFIQKDHSFLAGN